MMNRLYYLIILLLVFFIGCDLAKPRGAATGAAAAGATGADETAGTASGGTTTGGTTTGGTTVGGTATMNALAPGAFLDNENPPTVEAAPPKDEEDKQPNELEKSEKPEMPETELVKADVGAGKKGHYGQTGGEQASDIITVPIATLFRAKEMTAYRIQVPQALQLYKAMNDGKGPETHEAFMKDIIRANNIPLPELPEGHEYLYDPATEQLMIQKPR
ncbi:MAG: hypothetical protein LBQ50_03010 [Planctomycetaceae bacterium]|jgi:hypothetical protein|nr:hypothetical protein [Planctomycetaceae bacterium]